jgi:hypothetical protein
MPLVKQAPFTMTPHFKSFGKLPALTVQHVNRAMVCELRMLNLECDDKQGGRGGTEKATFPLYTLRVPRILCSEV